MIAGFIAEKILASGASVLYIAPSSEESLAVASCLKFLDSSLRLISVPEWDVAPYSLVSPSCYISGLKIAALAEMASDVTQAKTAYLTTLAAIMQKIPPLGELLEQAISLEVGESYDRNALLEKFIAFGYTRTSVVNNAGEFAVHGGVIDVVDYSNNCYRIDFVFSNVEKIKVVDLDTQLSKSQLDKLTILPMSEVIINSHTLSNFQNQFFTKFSVASNALYEDTMKGARCSGIENLLPLFYAGTKSIFDYIPQDVNVIVHSSLQQDLHDLALAISERHQRRTALNDAQAAFLPPQELYLEQERLLSYLQNYKLIKAEDNQNANIFPLIAISVNLDFAQLKQQLEISKICVACKSEKNRAKLELILQNANIGAAHAESIADIKKEKVVCLALFDLDAPLMHEKILFLSDSMFLGKQATSARDQNNRRSSKNAAKFFQELISIQHGELIVHAQFGIGKFAGISALQIENAVRDFVEIIYADNDKLYLPVENLDVISRYGESSEGVALDKLGSAAWQVRKASLKQKIKLAAAALLKIAAARELAEGLILEPVHEFYQPFIDKFPYLTTEDQEKAIADVIDGLSAGRPMDRLICADVGFGKTEVALRAACVAALGTQHVQVAVIVPTTLLARQHLATFAERFADLPVKIEGLSKFTSRKDVPKIKESIANGEVDIVIGTHALLAKDIQFQNLGLIIIDEEQHFGVVQKEKLKNLRANTHILTLSATPIPRTLQMSLLGIKELSLITTPPASRKHVKMTVSPYDPVIVRDALLQEKERRGLSFYVAPRISYLDEIEENLRKIVPELKVARAHGAMTAAKLDQVMNDFYDQKFDVLISTGIIESGLDIPIANTIIIDRAHMFGLAQLYQMRGRVGRSDVPAFAYLLTPKSVALKNDANKRLKVIQSLQGLGSGFCIASHDMDARGYGNLVGEEQSGHIKEVGIELYQKMLADAVADLRDQDASASRDWSPSVNIKLSVQLPESYISDPALRLSLYRQIAELSTEEDVDRFALEMIDRFGALHEETKQLFEVVKLKQMAKMLNIEKIDAGSNGLAFSFKDKKVKNHAALFSFIEKEREFEAKLKPDGKLVLLLRPHMTRYNALKSVKRVLLQLIEDDYEVR